MKYLSLARLAIESDTTKTHFSCTVRMFSTTGHHWHTHSDGGRGVSTNYCAWFTCSVRWSIDSVSLPHRLKALNGSHQMALAAKHHSVPVRPRRKRCLYNPLCGIYTCLQFTMSGFGVCCLVQTLSPIPLLLWSGTYASLSWRMCVFVSLGYTSSEPHPH